MVSRQSCTLIYSRDGTRDWMNYLPNSSSSWFKRHATRILRECVQFRPKTSVAQECNKKAIWRKLSDWVQQHCGCAQQEIISQGVKRTAGSSALAVCGVMDALPGYAESAESPHARPGLTRTALETSLTTASADLGPGLPLRQMWCKPDWEQSCWF